MNSSDPEAGEGGPFAGLDLLATAILIVDAGLVIQHANSSAQSLFDMGSRQLIGLSIDRLIPRNPDFARALRDASLSGVGFYEHDLAIERAAHGITHVNCFATPAQAALRSSQAASTVLEFRVVDQQLRIDREEKLVERQRLNRELLRNLAHEIKNPLGGIRGSAQLLERELHDPELREFTQVIVKEADRLQSLMNRMLAPARLPSVTMVNIHEVLERVRTLILAEFAHGELAIRRDYDTSLPELPGDREQLIQAVLNVVRNAAEAMGGKGEIVLGTRVARQVTIRRERFRLALLVNVIDNGPGVPPQLKDRIFFPLVSGRENGSGLGLSLAQDYVAQHGGVIEFESEPGTTQFTITLPVRPESVVTAAETVRRGT